MPLPPVVRVTWVKVLVVVSKRKISMLPSGFSPVRSAIGVKGDAGPRGVDRGTAGGELAPWCG